MDPNETLRMLRENAEVYLSTDDEETANDAAARVVDGFRSLDRWLRHGGFLPAEWQRVE